MRKFVQMPGTTRFKQVKTKIGGEDSRARDRFSVPYASARLERALQIAERGSEPRRAPAELKPVRPPLAAALVRDGQVVLIARDQTRVGFIWTNY